MGISWKMCPAGLKQTMLKDKRIQESFKGGPYSMEQLQYLADDGSAVVGLPKLLNSYRMKNWIWSMPLNWLLCQRFRRWS